MENVIFCLEGEEERGFMFIIELKVSYQTLLISILFIKKFPKKLSQKKKKNDQSDIYVYRITIKAGRLLCTDILNTNFVNLHLHLFFPKRGCIHILNSINQ